MKSCKPKNKPLVRLSNTSDGVYPTFCDYVRYVMADSLEEINMEEVDQEIRT